MKIEAWEDKNVYCNNCGFSKYEDDEPHGLSTQLGIKPPLNKIPLLSGILF